MRLELLGGCHACRAFLIRYKGLDRMRPERSLPTDSDFGSEFSSRGTEAGHSAFESFCVLLMRPEANGSQDSASLHTSA